MWQAGSKQEGREAWRQRKGYAEVVMQLPEKK